MDRHSHENQVGGSWLNRQWRSIESHVKFRAIELAMEKGGPLILATIAGLLGRLKGLAALPLWISVGSIFIALNVAYYLIRKYQIQKGTQVSADTTVVGTGAPAATGNSRLAKSMTAGVIMLIVVGGIIYFYQSGKPQLRSIEGPEIVSIFKGEWIKDRHPSFRMADAYLAIIFRIGNGGKPSKLRKWELTFPGLHDLGKGGMPFVAEYEGGIFSGSEILNVEGDGAAGSKFGPVSYKKEESLPEMTGNTPVSDMAYGVLLIGLPAGVAQCIGAGYEPDCILSCKDTTESATQYDFKCVYKLH